VTLEETRIKIKSTTVQTAQAKSKTDLRWNKLYIRLLQHETKVKVPVYYEYEYNAEQEPESWDVAIFEKPTFIESF
jgi:hypothetical protein